jgi:hypothetical protein
VQRGAPEYSVPRHQWPEAITSELDDGSLR